MEPTPRRWFARWPFTLRLFLVLAVILLAFGLLASRLPAALYPLLYVAGLTIALAYTWWEWRQIRRRRDALRRELRRQQEDWQQGLPAHLRSKGEGDEG